MRTELLKTSAVTRVLAATALLAGYVVLWQGSITIAPLILIIAYCVLIPRALLT